MADTAYDADHLRQVIAAKGVIAVIPNEPSRARNYPLDRPPLRRATSGSRCGRPD
jgi:hypothetical protein